jgi:hypothetical protein
MLRWYFGSGCGKVSKSGSMAPKWEKKCKNSRLKSYMEVFSGSFNFLFRGFKK